MLHTLPGRLVPSGGTRQYFQYCPAGCLPCLPAPRRWLELSPDAKHLLMGMLAYDPARRMTIEQVLAHEWVVSRGGVLPRPLGQDVVFGAATVASVRRLRNLCGGVVAFNRAAAALAGTPLPPARAQAWQTAPETCTCAASSSRSGELPARLLGLPWVPAGAARLLALPSVPA